MTVNVGLARDGTFPAILNHSFLNECNGIRVNGTIKARNVAHGVVYGNDGGRFAIIESSIATIYRSRIDYRPASFVMDENTALALARALLGPFYRIERIE